MATKKVASKKKPAAKKAPVKKASTKKETVKFRPWSEDQAPTPPTVKTPPAHMENREQYFVEMDTRLKKKAGNKMRHHHKYPDIRYLPIGTVEDQLDELYGWEGWSRYVVSVQFTVSLVTVVGRLVVRVGDTSVQRDGVATESLPAGVTPENSYGCVQKCLSNAIKNAAASLGDYFARYANRDEHKAPEKPKKEKTQDNKDNKRTATVLKGVGQQIDNKATSRLKPRNHETAQAHPAGANGQPQA